MAKINLRNRNLGKYGKDGKPKPANWEYRFEAAPVGGKRQSISKSGFHTKKEAEVAGAAALAEYSNAGTVYKPSDMSFADYLDYWFSSYVKMSCKYNTQNSYRIIIDRHLKPALGHYKLCALTPIALQEYVNNKYASGLKKTTLKSIMCVLTGSLKYAVLPSQLLHSSPAEYLKLPKVEGPRAEVHHTVLSVADFNRLMERFKRGNPYRYALLISFYTGLRIGEVYALTWDDIDLSLGRLSVNKIVYKRRCSANNTAPSPDANGVITSWYFGTPKTKSSNRDILIGKTLIRELKEYRAFQLTQRLAYDEYYTRIYKSEEKDEKGNTIYRLIPIEHFAPISLPEADMVMRKENGQYSSSDSFKYAARVIHYDLGMDFTFHSLRHTHATMLIENGVSPKAVQARLGHETIETTLQTYVHNTASMEQNAVDIFESAVSTT